MSYLTRLNLNPSESDREIWDLFDGRCVKCGNLAVTIHEIVPRSLAPKTWKNPENRVPLCATCHDWAHRNGTAKSRDILTQKRKDWLEKHRRNE